MSFNSRLFPVVTLVSTLAFSCGFRGPTALAQDGQPPTIVRVEEDWELEVGEPSLNSNAPQVCMTMTPFDGTDGHHFVVVLNLRTSPDYEPGGLQVQLWHGEDVLMHDTGHPTGQLAQTGEKVSWTQRLELGDGKVKFQVVDGHGDTWGDFGGGYDLNAQFDSELTSLVGYNPYVSIESSGITYAGNRVASLVLKQIRWYTDTGALYYVSAPIDIDTDLDPWD